MSFLWLRQRVKKYLMVVGLLSGRGAGRAFREVKLFRPRAEVLEDRTVPSTVDWVGGSGDWANANNWLDEDTQMHHVPTANDDASINVPGITVTHNSGVDSVGFLDLEDPLSISAGSLAVSFLFMEADLSVTGGSLTLNHGSAFAGSTLSVGPSGTLNDNGDLTIGGSLTNSGTINDNGAVAISGGSLTNTATGTITIGSGRTLNVMSIPPYGASFTQNGTLNGPGTLALNGGTLTLGVNLSTADLGLTVSGVAINNGTGTLTNAAGHTLAITESIINAALVNQGTLLEQGTSGRIGGAFNNAAGATLRVQNSLQVSSGFTNAGAIELNGGGLYVSSGTLTNTGFISTTGSSAFLQLVLDNQGTLTVGANQGFQPYGACTNSGTINVSGGDLTLLSSSFNGSLTNAATGIITIGSGRTFNDGGGGFSGIPFTQNGTLSGPGTLALNGGSTLTLGVNLSTAGLGLTISGTTINGTGTLTNATGQTLPISGASTINTALVNQGTLVTTGNTTLGGAFSNVVGATLQVGSILNAGSFTNAGAIVLSGLLSIPLLTNTGTISTVAGGATFSAALDNQGSLTVGSDTLFFIASALTNSGTVNVNGGDLRFVPFSGPLTNTAAGTITIGSGRTLTAASFTNFSGGTLGGGTYNVAGTFQFDNAAIVTNAATIVLDGASARIIDQSSHDALAGTFAVNTGSFSLLHGAALTTAGDFENDGILTIGPGSTFSVSGNFTQGSAATLDLQLGGTGAGQFGQLAVTGTATLAGTLQDTLVNGYVPTTGDTFQILTYGARSGDFAGGPAGFSRSFDDVNGVMTLVAQ